MASFTAQREFRHEDVPFDPAEDAQPAGDRAIEALRAQIPHLKVYGRASPRYDTLRQVYNLQVTAKPLVICRPQTIPQVQAIVRLVVDLGLPLGARCGGHDVWGRGCVADSVTIDMREMDTQQLAADKQTVTIGGGVTSGNLVGFLDSHGLCTANGTARHVGWTGWAIWGGYGPMNDYVGLGVDNIVSAKMVTSQGDLVEADDELLWGIRGAGGNLGIIVETQVKTHHMPKVLAGFIGYAWEEAEKVLLGLQEILDAGVPDAVGVQMGFIKSRWGLGMTLIFIWPSSNTKQGEVWLEKIRGLGTVSFDTVSQTTFKDFQKMTSETVDDPVHVYTRSSSILRFTASTIQHIKRCIEDVPDTRQYSIVAHIGHGQGTRPNESSCFATRQPHILFHINGCDEVHGMHDAAAWVDDVVSGLKSTGEVIKPVYVSFMGDDEATHQSFGDGWERLKSLKRRYDGSDTFCHSQPKLPVN